MQPVSRPVSWESEEHDHNRNVVHFEQNTEHRLIRALDEIAALHDEIRRLRLALAHSERHVAHRDVLLRNALQREQELRSAIVRHRP
ncbi:MAG: hypothetical protein U0Z53_09345 [Blastocatellia bacterium]